MAILTKPDETTVKVEPKNGTNFELEELYGYLECNMIEISRCSITGQIIVSDEEAGCRGDLVNHPTFGVAIQVRRGEYLPFLNRHATTLLHPSLVPFGYNNIFGNALICEDRQIN